jgi:iduronate 2-sulfatase
VVPCEPGVVAVLTRRNLLLGGLAAPSWAQQARRPNVLFITVDDLRPQLGCYGAQTVKSPNIDRLASRGVLFQRAYCQQALCAPSRTSFLTGLRPDTTGVYDIETHFRTTLPNAITLPQLYKDNGYVSRGFYKIFHLAGFDPKIGNLNDERSWSDPLYLPRKSVYGPEGEAVLRKSYEAIHAAGKKPDYTNIPRSFAVEAPEVNDEDLSDGEVARAAVDALRRHRNQPFFMAVGFYKPHLPFVAPKRYWELYDRREIQLPANQFAPKGAPEYAVPSWNELRGYVDMPKSGPMPEELGRKILHGYLASISFVDAQVGLLLSELDRLKLRDNTVVVLLGDHGYQVGEHGTWANKHSNFETSARVPLIVSAPGMRRGAKSDEIIELIDLYPTLAELSGLKGPAQLEGKSFVPLLKSASAKGKQAAYTQYPRGSRMGRSVCDRRYRYTEWTAAGGGLDAVELYDHDSDPQENASIANGQPEVAARMRTLLRRGGKD